MTRSRSAHLLILGATLMTLSCAGTQRPRGRTYADRARNAYDEANERLNTGDPVEAGEALRRVRRDYGLSRWGWLAELRLADLDQRQERYTQAVQGYRSWIRYHPTQPEAVYAHFQIARSYYLQIPNEFALFLASWERDQSSTRDGENELVRFLEDYATSEHAPRAREFLRRVRELLARAEIHIAQFYFGRGRFDAAISRYRTVLDRYQGSGLEPEALLRIGETYLEMGRRSEARQAFESLVQSFPASSLVESARRYLAFIGRNPGGATAAPASAPASAPVSAPASAPASAPVRPAAGG